MSAYGIVFGQSGLARLIASVMKKIMAWGPGR